LLKSAGWKLCQTILLVAIASLLPGMRISPLTVGKELDMSHFDLSLRLVGEIDELERAAAAMSDLSYELYRKGQVYPHRVRPQPVNVLLLELGKWEHGLTTYVDARQDPAMTQRFQSIQGATHLLRQLAPVLAALDPQRCRKEVYLFTLRTEDTGGLELPADFIAAAASANLELALSISIGNLEDEKH
jgi:hypothetical protein